MSPTDLPEPGRYRHFKGGEYELFAVARHSETEEWHAVYRPVGGEWWIRPLAMFAEEVEHEGRRVQRFERVG